LLLLLLCCCAPAVEPWGFFSRYMMWNHTCNQKSLVRFCPGRQTYCITRNCALTTSMVKKEMPRIPARTGFHTLSKLYVAMLNFYPFIHDTTFKYGTSVRKQITHPNTRFDVIQSLRWIQHQRQPSDVSNSMIQNRARSELLVATFLKCSSCGLSSRALGRPTIQNIIGLSPWGSNSRSATV
jgi:hypothetical protein